MKRIELRSPLARAVVPVAAGLAFFAVLGLILWGFAALIAKDPDRITNLAPEQFEVGRAETIAAVIEEDGPILFPGLGPDVGDRTIVLNHTGGDPLFGWRVYLAHPADREPTCIVEQVPNTSTFTDCDGRTITVDELSPPAAGIGPLIPDRKTLWIDLTPDASVVEATDDSAPPTT